MIKNDTPIFKVSQVAKHLNMSADRLRTYDEEFDEKIGQWVDLRNIVLCAKVYVQ